MEVRAHGLVEIGKAIKPEPVSPQRASLLLRRGRIDGAMKEWCSDHGRIVQGVRGATNDDAVQA
jgi:hypothetical protein